MNINEIANLANNKKRLSKADQWLDYERLVKILDATDLTDGDAYRILVSMYNHFQPSTPAKPKTPEQWLAKAMADKNDVRYYLQYICADGSNLVATDGHRLHIYTANTLPDGVKTLPDGFYDKNMQKIELDAKFPNYKRVLPNSSRMGHESRKLTKSFLLSGEIRVHGGKEEAINVIGDIWVNKQYLVDALSFWDSSETVEINYAGAMDSITISANDCLAVIMPIRV
jgi:DNA polymerase III sliding clamp (beta) subunit (PCNA family)